MPIRQRGGGVGFARFTRCPVLQIRIDGCQASPRAGALYATFANAAGAPSISVPVPWHPGIGMQLTGAPGDDAQLLAWAWECEQAMLA